MESQYLQYFHVASRNLAHSLSIFLYYLKIKLSFTIVLCKNLNTVIFQ